MTSSFGDLILLTVDNLHTLDVQKYISLMRVFGEVQCGDEAVLHMLRRGLRSKDTFVLGSLDDPIGSISVLYDCKLFHDGKYAAHIEDVVISEDARRAGTGSHMVRLCIECIRQRGDCYKVILSCDPALICFYERCAFAARGTTMRLDL